MLLDLESTIKSSVNLLLPHCLLCLFFLDLYAMHTTRRPGDILFGFLLHLIGYLGILNDRSDRTCGHIGHICYRVKRSRV